MNLDINDLIAFRAVAELGNFRKAAESIHISQPAFKPLLHFGFETAARTACPITSTTSSKPSS